MVSITDLGLSFVTMIQLLVNVCAKFAFKRASEFAFLSSYENTIPDQSSLLVSVTHVPSLLSPVLIRICHVPICIRISLS